MGPSSGVTAVLLSKKRRRDTQMHRAAGESGGRHRNDRSASQGLATVAGRMLPYRFLRERGPADALISYL